jgi:hypothetical protein
MRLRPQGGLGRPKARHLKQPLREAVTHHHARWNWWVTRWCFACCDGGARGRANPPYRSVSWNRSRKRVETGRGNVLSPGRESVVSKATSAIRSGMPARRAIVEWTASTIRSAVPTGTAASKDKGDVARCRLVGRVDRHRPGWRHRHHAETDSKRRCDKQFHGLLLSC